MQSSSAFPSPSTLRFKVGELIIVFLVPIILIIGMKGWIGEDPIRNIVVIWLSYIFMFLMIWVGVRLRGESWSNWGITFKALSMQSSIRGFGWSIIVFLGASAAFVLASIIMAYFFGIPESADFSKYDYLKDNLGMLILTLAGVYLVSSFGEEVIFRAFLINRISEIGQNTKLATNIAVALSAIIFAFAHFEWGPVGIAQTGAMGLVLSIAYVLLRKRFWILVLAHAYMDTILIVQMYLASN